MSYIGQQLPADVFSGFTTDTFAGDGSATTFTLSKAPFSENGLIVVINNVIQKPTTNFTVSGTTLTIVGTAVASGDVIYAIHTSGAVPSTLASKVDVNGLSDGVILDADADTTISADTDDQIDFKAGGTDIMSLTATTATFNDGVTITTADNTDTLTLISTDTDANAGPILVLNRDSASPADGDSLGALRFAADDDAGNSTNFFSIESFIRDASNGSEDVQMVMYGMSGGSTLNIMEFDTVGGGVDAGPEVVFNDGSSDIDFRVESNNKTHLLFIDAGDDRTHFGSTGYQGEALGVHNFYGGTTTDQSNFKVGSNSASFAHDIQRLMCLRDQTNQYYFIRCFTGNSSDDVTDDLEFAVKGDGNVSCDESFTGSGADYAEYFEWKDGNASDEDRIGMSVKLDGNKIVPSSDSDDASDIIGVVSGSPVIIGDADGTGVRWTQKYLKDDYGRKLKEEYTVTTWRDEANKEDHSYATDRIPSDVTVPSDAKVTTTELDGVTKLLRPKINPDYDKTKTYVSREDRKEWDTVGLVGKLRIKKGQKTGTNWIKMRDISDTVEEWLVR